MTGRIVIHDNGFTLLGNFDLAFPSRAGIGVELGQVDACSTQKMHHLPSGKRRAVKFDTVLVQQVHAVTDRNLAATISDNAAVKRAVIKAATIKFYDLIYKLMTDVVSHGLALRKWLRPRTGRRSALKPWKFLSLQCGNATIAEAGGVTSLSGGCAGMRARP